MKKKKLKKKYQEALKENFELKSIEYEYNEIKDNYYVLIYDPDSKEAEYLIEKQKALDELSRQLDMQLFLGSASLDAATKGLWEQIENQTGCQCKSDGTDVDNTSEKTP